MEAIPSNNSIKLSLMAYTRRHIETLSPVFRSFFVQLLALGGAYLLILALNVFLGANISPIQGALLQGTIALVLSHKLNFALWWYFINFVFAPALIGTLYLQIPPLYFLFAFVLMVTIYWSTFRSQVPLYLSSRKAWQAIVQLLPSQSGFRFIDLGSGLGGLLGYLHKIRPDGSYRGIENAPLPFLISWLRYSFAYNLKSSWGNFWTHDLADYDVVYAYLSPVPMAELWKKASTEMRPGTLFISNTFNVPGVSPTKVIELDDFNRSKLYLWRM